MKYKYGSMAVLCSLALITVGCKQQELNESAPVRVQVMKVKPVQSDGRQRFSGTVEEALGSTLSFSVAGTVKQIRVEAGQRVVKGEWIAMLDEVSLLSTYEAAVATLEQAEDAWQRMKQLHDAGSLPEMQWVEVQSKLKQAQSAERIAKKNLADSKLYAPFSGVVSEKEVEVGQNVMPGTPVVRLVTVNQVKVNVSVPENEISHIRIGQPVSVSVSALGGKVFEGKVVEKGVVAHPLSRSYEVKALVDNPSEELRPGMICTLATELEEGTEIFMLPVHLIQMDENNGCFVWINKDGKAKRRRIVTGRLEKKGIQVISGLTAGDEIIVEGQQKISEGMDITLK